MLLKTLMLNTNIDKICRLCLYQGFKTETEIEIMSFCKIPDLINKIKDCVALEIDTNEKLPSMICLGCLQQLNQWASFKEVCHQSQGILLESLAALETTAERKVQELQEAEVKIDNDDDSSESEGEDNAYDENYVPEGEAMRSSRAKCSMRARRSMGASSSSASSDEEKIVKKRRGRPPGKKKIVPKGKKIVLKGKRKYKTKKVVKIESESSEEELEDTVEGLEKYLYRLCEEDAQNELKKEVAKVFSYECEICHAVFSSMFDYLDHQNKHNGQPVFHCYRCTAVFTSRVDLVEHDNRHQVPCPKCGKMILPGCLKTHMVLHTDKYKCMQCNWRFCNSTMLRQHIESVHIRLKTHVCERCGKSFTSTTSLQTHIKIHSEVRPYNCKVCEYSGRTASALYTHMARHENGLHVCEICAKSFKSFRSLRDHTRRVHSEKKNHECGFCHKKFVDKYMLTVHTRTHTGARPYACTLCDRAFVRSDGLREHLATHGQRASYNCTQCGKKFIYRRSLGRHTCTAVIN